jgi:hypothetical protein
VLLSDQTEHQTERVVLGPFSLTGAERGLFLIWRTSSGSLAMFLAISRALTANEVNNDTRHSHTDNNSGCNIDTGTPTPLYEYNRNCRNDKSPVSQGLGGGGDGPTAFSRTMPVAQTELLYSGALHSQKA